MTEVEALKAENESLKQLLSKTNAEKTAIDQYCLENIQSNIKLRTQILLADENFNKAFMKVSTELQELKTKLVEFEVKSAPVTELHSVTDDAIEAVVAAANC